MATSENLRIQDHGNTPIHQWHKWGPYVAERSWGTVREDYSWNGDAWSAFPFEEAHKKVYRWGEDGIAGWCDRYQTLVFAPAFWNGKDPILKERLFGLSSPEGNHGEDVKECYYYLDATPSHSYMKYLYKYPQLAFPYTQLKKTNKERSAVDGEFELIDTHVFDDGAYFDITIEYAKIDPEELFIKIEAINRGSKPAPLHLIAQLFFRNQWGWSEIELGEPAITKLAGQSAPCLFADDSNLAPLTNIPFDYRIGPRYLYGSEGGKPLFTNNENLAPDKSYTKDGFHRAIIEGAPSINPEEIGTKAALHYRFDAIKPQTSAFIYLRFATQEHANPLEGAEELIQQRKREADAFYATVHPENAGEELCRIQRQAIAGILWNKQFYYFDVNQWLKGDNPLDPPPLARMHIRNFHWRHLNSMRILSMPDKWEYCWFAAWDLAFHCLTLALVDIEFAKEQLWLLLFDQFQHPNGAIPAYEWEFSDLNPPVQAWAAYQLFLTQKRKTGVEDRSFLKRCFLKLIMNFAYWVNQVDSSGCNVFEGGFLGLDNITLIDRSKERPGGALLKQSDGTGWMAFFSLNLMRIALELAKEDPTYEGMATKFFQHFVYIAYAMRKRDESSFGLWDAQDGFYYDVLLYPDGRFAPFKVRSLVGLIPLFAVEEISEAELELFPTFKRDFLWFIKNRKLLTQECITWVMKEGHKHYVLTLLSPNHLQSVLGYLWDPKEFRSPYGIRSLSKIHETKPFYFRDDQISYEPAESRQKMKGGNSNWRGPVWMPMNYLILCSLKKYSCLYNSHFKIEIEGEEPITLQEMAATLCNSLLALFLPNTRAQRPFLGESFPYHNDPHFQDHLLFYEYFHGDSGQGLGASHQTGWTALVANIIDDFFSTP